MYVCMMYVCDLARPGVATANSMKHNVMLEFGPLAYYVKILRHPQNRKYNGMHPVCRRGLAVVTVSGNTLHLSLLDLNETDSSAWCPLMTAIEKM